MWQQAKVLGLERAFRQRAPILFYKAASKQLQPPRSLDLKASPARELVLHSRKTTSKLEFQDAFSYTVRGLRLET